MIRFDNVSALTFAGKAVAKLELAGRKIWEKAAAATYKNWVKYSTDATGVTIYNGGLGYKDGTRVRSGGAEGTSATASCTGFIPAKAGDTVRLSGWDALTVSGSNSINVFDANHTNLGQAVDNVASSGYGIFASAYKAYGWASVKEETAGVYAWTVPPDASIAFIRITGNTGADGSKMIVTINEEIS